MRIVFPLLLCGFFSLGAATQRIYNDYTIHKIAIDLGCANYDEIDGHFYWHKALPDLSMAMPLTHPNQGKNHD